VWQGWVVAGLCSYGATWVWCRAVRVGGYGVTWVWQGWVGSRAVQLRGNLGVVQGSPRGRLRGNLGVAGPVGGYGVTWVWRAPVGGYGVTWV
jgi:hypothetical protein